MHKSFRDENGLAPGVGQDVRDFVFRGIRKYRDRDTSERHKREHCHSPVRHVLGKDGDLVPGPDPVPGQSVGNLVAFALETSVRVAHVRVQHHRHPVLLVEHGGEIIKFGESVNVLFAELEYSFVYVARDDSGER